jgi:hypothetical protein
MKGSFGILARQLLFVSLCAWGVVTILEVAAIGLTAMLGSGTTLTGPSPTIVAVVWLGLASQLSHAMIWNTPSRR